MKRFRQKFHLGSIQSLKEKRPKFSDENWLLICGIDLHLEFSIVLQVSAEVVVELLQIPFCECEKVLDEWKEKWRTTDDCRVERQFRTKWNWFLQIDSSRKRRVSEDCYTWHHDSSNQESKIVFRKNENWGAEINWSFVLPFAPVQRFSWRKWWCYNWEESRYDV